MFLELVQLIDSLVFNGLTLGFGSHYWEKPEKSSLRADMLPVVLLMAQKHLEMSGSVHILHCSKSSRTTTNNER